MTRLSKIDGEWIDRSQTVCFKFEGKDVTGFSGDVVSSALWADGQKLIGRSFKYHRPRGILSLANHDTNSMLQNGQQLNVRGDVTNITASMNLTAVNTYGGVAYDKGRILNSFSRFLPVGFYYKSFYSKKLFPIWERMFRNMTGLGKVDLATPLKRTAKQYDFCDVLVIGAGASGLSAALAAASQGADVVLVDENAKIGGSLSYAGCSDSRHTQLRNELFAKIAADKRIRVLTGTVAAGYYTDHWIPLVDGDRMTKMRAGSVVVASGCYEQPAIFHNNDLPGSMLASAAQRLVYRYAVKPMNTAVALVANADGYQAVLDLMAQNINIAAVVDLRPVLGNTSAELSVVASGTKIYSGHMIYEAIATENGKGITGVKIVPFTPEGSLLANQSTSIRCDGVLMSVGWAPTANLLYQAGTRMRFNNNIEQFVPAQLPEGVFACGRVNGVHTLENRRQDGIRAGLAAAAVSGFGVAQDIVIPEETSCPSHWWPIASHPKGKNFVDFDEDLQLKDFEHAVQEGFDNIELLKRFSTVGMGPSQGKHSNMNALRILARLTGKAPQQVGTTTARPFFHPVPMSILGGRGFNPERRTPLHERHEALGACWMAAGVWQRPEYYTQLGKERSECIRSEVASVRQQVGMIDVGTLGKLEVIGPDAAEFLERVYISRYANLKVGMTRYAVMCDESGVIIDDGVVARLAEDHFYFTTTTSNAAYIYRELSRLNTMWQLDCGIVNQTGSFAAMNLAGPKSKDVLARVTDLDLSVDAFPYLAVREGLVAGIPARLMRVGFVGEWGYEIHVPACYGLAVWDALMAAGNAEGIRPFGVEAQRLLRMEKGHIIVGQDTDGLTSCREVGLDWALKLDKPFFIGQRSQKIIDQKAKTQQLVGFTLAKDIKGRAPQECHLVIAENEIAGRITSVAWSPTLDSYIGLAFVQPKLSEPGTPISIRLSDGSTVQASVVSTPFYDPENLRQKVLA